MNKKELVVKYRPLVRLACGVHNLSNALRIKKHGGGNRIIAPCALLKKLRVQFSGSNNTLIVEDFSILKGVSIYVSGDNNVIRIGSWCHLLDTEFCMEEAGNTITIGERSRLLGRTHLAAMEGTHIRIGRECLFSSDIHFRTGDSHSVLDMEGRRINPSGGIDIGDHVWVGTKVTCLKGAKVPPHSIVGACALVTKQFDEPNCALAGVPARVVKRGVDWSIQRIPMGETAPDFQQIT